MGKVDYFFFISIGFYQNYLYFLIIFADLENKINGINKKYIRH